VVVSPDVGRMRVASCYAQCLGAPLIVLHKRRLGSAETEVTHVVGQVARSKLSHPAVQNVFVTDTVALSVRPEES